ncbi:putative DUF2993 family protein [Corynebacterium mustelae]|uniref:Putative DUF2993 family protein n=1 Tax=Corynebacterium mustelae TaxID=571915 RepID=A0A0G3GYP4_9CORY|nr:DUF2993 domain-containing protein [Corynebacterium mustelae]AKK04648.1 putative DUF2993 family protein [Corynebacterium mustelae]
MRTFGKVLVGIVALLLILIFVAEFGLRWYLGNEMKQSFSASSETGQSQEVDVAFGSTPLLFGIAKGEIPYIKVDAPSSATVVTNPQDGLPDLQGNPETHMVMNGLKFQDTQNPTARTLEMETVMRDEVILALIQRSIASQQPQTPQLSLDNFSPNTESLQDLAQGLLQNIIKVTNVTSKKAENSIDVEFTNGAATLTLLPEVENGQVKFTVKNTALFGFDLPAGASDAITNGLSSGVGSLTDTGLTMESITVEDGGIRMKLRGENVNLNELGNQPYLNSTR